jgi:hypothetical protein
MPILEEQIREENPEVSEEEMLEEMAEVRQAEGAQELLVDAWGSGLDEQTLVRYDQTAHHVAHAAGKEKLAKAEHVVATQWDPIHAQYEHQFTALAGVESIKAQVIAPVLEKKTAEARAELESRATDLLATVVGGTKTRDQIFAEFCGSTSLDVVGAEYHPVAIDVYERLVAPVAKDPEPVVEVEEEQRGKAEEQIEEEEEKQSA